MAARPDRSYKHQGWAGWGDWLGFGPPITSIPSKRRRQYRPFNEAREFVRSLGLGGQKDWFRYCRGDLPEKGEKPGDIPAHPREVYKNEGWVGYGDWVGTGVQKASGVWRPFEEAREFARALELRNSIEWQEYLAGKFPNLPSRPRDIPANPHKLHAYKVAGWSGYPDWLGCKRIFKSYEEAKSFVHKLGLRSTREWEAFCQGKYTHKGTRPPDIPRSPEAYYRDKGWKDYKDWLGLE